MPSGSIKHKPEASNGMFDFAILRELRKRDALTIADVSERSGISAAVISRLERNQSTAELTTLYRLARVFGLSATDLLQLVESRTAHRTEEGTHSSGDFRFREVRYGNVRCLQGRAPAGGTVSKPKIHRADYELCWVLKGAVRIALPHEEHTLQKGECLQFDAILEHTYEVLDDCEILVLHLRKEKRF